MTIYASTEPNPDPFPWVNEAGEREPTFGFADHLPRAGYDQEERTHQPNPILLQFRREKAWSRRAHALDYVRYLNQYALHILPRLDPEPIDHARRVLMRYLSIYS